jgi:hypothetical protein
LKRTGYDRPPERNTVRRIDRHGVNLIAGNIAALMLKNQLLVIAGEIRLGVLSPKSKLAGILQMLLFLQQER